MRQPAGRRLRQKGKATPRGRRDCVRQRQEARQDEQAGPDHVQGDPKGTLTSTPPRRAMLGLRSSTCGTASSGSSRNVPPTSREEPVARAALVLSAALAAVAGATAAAAAPRVRVMVVGRTRSAAGAADGDRGTALVRASGKRCAAAAGTPLAALAGARRAGGRRSVCATTAARARADPRDGARAVRHQVGADRNRGRDGWTYKVGPRSGTAGAADPAGPFGSGCWGPARRSRGSGAGCRGGGSCQRTLGVRSAGRVARGGRLRVSVRGYDDFGHGVAVRGARVRLGGAQRDHGRARGGDRARAAGPGSGPPHRHPARPGPGLRPHRRRRPMIGRAVALALLVAVAVAGCGLGAGGDVGRVTIVVTRDFGRVALRGSPVDADAPGGETVMRALERHFDGHHALRRWLRPVDRRRSRRNAGRPPGRLVLLRQRDRGPARLGRHRPAPRRRRLVGPPRLGRRPARPRGRRRVPRAVPARQRRQALPDPGGVHPGGRERVLDGGAAVGGRGRHRRRGDVRHPRRRGPAAGRRRAVGADPR